jgi:hypothetical protein
MGLQQTWQSSIYDWPPADRSSSIEMLSPQKGQLMARSTCVMFMAEVALLPRA